MPKTMQWLLSLSAACVFTALPAFAQENKSDDPDLREVEQYTLSMDNVTRFTDALQALKPVLQSHPEYGSLLEMDGDKNESLDDVAKRISRAPGVVEAMAKHGFTPRQFVLEEMVLMQAAMGAGMKPADQSDAEFGKKAHINPANLAFVRQHKEEIEKLQGKGAEE